MRILSYIRVSGQSQVDGDGFPRQREAIEKFCSGHSLVFSGEYPEDVSGTVEGMDRPKFLAMIERIEFLRKSAPEELWIEAVVVERLDRLARDLMVSEFLLRECRERGIKVFATDQGSLVDMASNGDDPTRKLFRQIVGAMAEWEKSMLVKKLRSARQRKKLQTGRCEGVRPYGELPGEQPTLETLKAWRASGHSYAEIANRANEHAWLTRKQKKWNFYSVRNVLEKRSVNRKNKKP